MDIHIHIYMDIYLSVYLQPLALIPIIFRKGKTWYLGKILGLALGLALGLGLSCKLN